MCLTKHHAMKAYWGSGILTYVTALLRRSERIKRLKYKLPLTILRIIHNRGSSVSIVTSLRDGQPGFHSRQGQ
jgi:hypothetical protein